MKRHAGSMLVLSIMTAVIWADVARAVTWSSLSTGGDFYWNQDANWDAAFPNGPGAVAVISGNFTGGDVNVRPGQNVTIGSLTVGDTAADPSSGYGVEIGKTWELPSLTFQAAPGQPTYLTVPVNVAQDPWYQADAVISASITLGGTSPLVVQPEGELSLNLVNLQGNSLTITNATGAALLGFGGEISGGATSHLVGNAGTGFTKYNAGYTGTAEVNAGTWSFVSGGLIAASRMTLHEGGLVYVGSGSAYNPNPGQRLPTNTLVFAGGQLYHGGQPLAGAALNQTVGDTANRIEVTDGDTRVQMTASATTSGTYLRARELIRTPGALLVLAADKLGGQSGHHHARPAVPGRRGAGWCRRRRGRRHDHTERAAVGVLPQSLLRTRARPDRYAFGERAAGIARQRVGRDAGGNRRP